MRRRTWLVAVALAAVAAAGGCGSDYPVAPVAGRVTLNGKPLAGASVEFQPVGKGGVDPGPGSMAVTDSDGRFTLMTQLPPSRPGAVLGTHKVRIYVYTEHKPDDTRDADSGGKKKKPAGPLIPPRYNSDTQLTLEVPAAGLPDHKFELTSP